MTRLAAAALVLALSVAATTSLAMLSVSAQQALADAAAVRAKAVLGKPPDSGLSANASPASAVGAMLESLPRAPKPLR